jgi:histidine triad (HIT) family protein
MDTIFHRIAAKEVPAFVIAEDDNFMAFLDLFPITPAQAVVIPKHHVPSKFSEVPADIAAAGVNFAQKVAKQLETKLENVLRVTVAIEGLEIDYFHIKLYPVYNGVHLPNQVGGEKADEAGLARQRDKLVA